MGKSRRHDIWAPSSLHHSVNHEWQRRERRRHRRIAKIKLSTTLCDTKVPTFKPQFCNEWNSPRDGKMRYNYPDLYGTWNSKAHRK